MKVWVLIFFLSTASLLRAQDDALDDMVLIRGAAFDMGKTVEDGADYSPAHRVTVDDFYMDRHEVTNAEYKKFCEATGYRYPEFWNMDIFRSGDRFPDHPVVGISWQDAQNYAKWAGKRLPTEAEWEYSARGGLSGKNYPNGDTLERTEEKRPAGSWTNMIVEVERFKPNGYGLYDMDGNVWEWVHDGFDDEYYRTGPADNPKGPDGKFIKVIRSGSWHSGAMCKRVYYRKGLPSNWVDFAVGFRCARSLSQ
jgi:formylglycine-generating enzyme required for sulfatase activity